MSIERINLPVNFTWDSVKGALEDWTFRLLQSQSFVPSGFCGEFAGTVAPEGWLLCDGTEYEIDQYPTLAKIIGVESSPGMFEVPVGGALATGQAWIIKT